jgi:hypothetical protein
MALRVFISTNFEKRGLVRELKAELRALGLEPSSSWAEAPGEGLEDETPLTREEKRRVAAKNDTEIANAHVLLVIGTDRGGEHLAEARFALMLGVPVVWRGRTILSTSRRGVFHADSADDALDLLRRLDALITKPWPTDLDWAREEIMLAFEREERAEVARALTASGSITFGTSPAGLAAIRGSAT